MISHRFWQWRFHLDEAVIGKTLQLNNATVTIVGITPPGFDGTLGPGSTPEVTLPMALGDRLTGDRSQLSQRVYWWLHIMGRLRPGVTASQAQARLEPIFVQAAQEAWTTTSSPTGTTQSLEGRDKPRLQLDPGGQGLIEVARRLHEQPLRILTVVVGLVLLIACANVANLLLARSATRAKEIAVRLSVGASRWRLVRQLLVESLVLSLFGGALGVLVAYWGRNALLHLRPIGNSSGLDLDVPVLAFTFGISALTGLLFGVVPAWRATRVDLNTALKENSGGSAGRSRFTLRRALMIGQVALSVILLVGAGLFLRTLHNLRTIDVGFNREHLLVFSLDASLNGYRGAQIAPFFDRLSERLAAIPGVHSVAHARHPLLSGSRRSSGITLRNPRLPPNQNFGVNVNVVSPGFFSTMEIPLILGRNVTARETENSPAVVIVNERFARTFFPGESPIGQTFGLNGQDREIVGVVRDAFYADLRNPIPPTVYLPFHQRPEAMASFAVRTRGDPLALAGAIRATAREVDPNLPLMELRTQQQQIDRLVSQERMFATLSTFFGGVALVLTCIGLYGLLAHQVTARTREIGIRLALGAQLRAVMALVLGEGLRMAALGVVIGVGSAFALTRFVSRLLFNVPPTDPVTLIGAGVLLVGVAALACLLPARRAAKVDPMIALRCE